MSDPFAFLSPLLLVLGPAFAFAASLHILLTKDKDDVRAAIGWLGVVWLFPVGGALLYVVFGINRLRRRARRVRGRTGTAAAARAAARRDDSVERTIEALAPHLVGLARLGRRLTGEPLLTVDGFEPLIEGEAAYPAMLRAIDEARREIRLATYIFDWDAVGTAFAERLLAARGRGVDVRVLVDAVGSAGVARRLRRLGLDARAFNPPGLKHLAIVNLRNHRKLLLVDGERAFLGGMNISARHRADGPRRRRSRDVMFRLSGEVVAALERSFLEDWAEIAAAPAAPPPSATPAGDEDGAATVARAADAEGAADAEDAAAVDPPPCAFARVVADGPDQDFPRLAWILDAAISLAQRSVHVLTPYFVPDRDLVASLAQASMRGVDVAVCVPARSNHRLVDWASRALWPALLHAGCRILETPPPMDHAKMVVVDGQWAVVGSSNWDIRSFRLNFELNLELYGRSVAGTVAEVIAARTAVARAVPTDWAERRALLLRLRDRLAWLASPYL